MKQEILKICTNNTGQAAAERIWELVEVELGVARQDGYEDGYDHGYDDGYDEGHQDGYDEATND